MAAQEGRGDHAETETLKLGKTTHIIYSFNSELETDGEYNHAGSSEIGDSHRGKSPDTPKN